MSTGLPAWPAGLGSLAWVVGDGYIPPSSTGPAPDFVSHDSICMVNTSGTAALVSVWICFTDRDPAGPFTIRIGSRRAFHQRINDLRDPEPIPPGVDYSIVVSSTQPIVVQHTRLDSRQEANALMSTIAFPGMVSA